MAPIYRRMERWLAGGKLQRARLAQLHQIPEARAILMLGEGPGRLLEVLLDTFPHAAITVVDQSRSMLDQAQKSFAGSDHRDREVRFLCQNVLVEGIPEGPFDLITTPFFLDCFPEVSLEGLIQNITASSAAQAHWLIADFQIPERRGWKRWRSACIHWIMYAFFRRVTGIPASHWVDPDRLLSTSGWQLGGRSLLDWELIRSDWWRRSMQGPSSDNADRPR